ncbi:DUF2271 domain-containing protein [Colwelliaceae bacterium 6441]
MNNTQLYNAMKKSIIAMIFIAFASPLLSQAATNDSSKLAMVLVLKQQQGEYHPPYVAAWIENSERQSVRTLLLWRKEPKWLKDIRRWWRNVGRKDSNLVDAITSATHAAGSFPLTFNLEDDNQQTLIKGKYTLYLEVVREKGSRALLEQTFTLDNKTQQNFTLNETAETGTITLTITP